MTETTSWDEPHHIVIIVDGPDPDNYACALAAASPILGMNVAAVLMTGRPVSAAQNAKPYEFNPAASRAVRRDNALHMKGFLLRYGREDIPVFEGLRAPYSSVPHWMHLRERVTDVEDDAHAGHELGGNFDEAVVFLGGLEGTIHLICGGPLTDAAQLMKEPMVSNKLGIMTTQLGMFGSQVKAMAGGRRQFNVLADPVAAHTVLQGYPGSVYLVPSDITKHPDHGFDDPEDIATLAESPAFDELVKMYRQAWPIIWGASGAKIHLHDFHPAELMSELHRAGYPKQNPGQLHDLGRYTMAPITIDHVPHAPQEMARWGEIDLGGYDYRGGHPRFLVTGIDTGTHRHILASVLNGQPGIPSPTSPLAVSGRA